MFQLVVCDYAILFKIVQDFVPTHTISLIESIEPINGKHLHINVNDVKRPTQGYVHPEMYHLKEILEFTKDLTDDDRLVIHCYAGQSRSTAIAIGVLIQHGMDFKDAFDTVASLRPILLPNQLFIQLIDDYFKLDGKLENLVRDFRMGIYERTFEQYVSNDEKENMKQGFEKPPAC